MVKCGIEGNPLMYPFVSEISCSHTKRSHVHRVLSNKLAVLPCRAAKKKTCEGGLPSPGLFGIAQEGSICLSGNLDGFLGGK